MAGEDRSSDAEAIFARAIEAESFDLEPLVERHPELEAELRRLHANWMQLEALLGPPPDSSPPESSRTGATRAFPAAAPRVAPGARLGPYRLLDALGEGGQGAVFLAEDTRLDRRVALKLLHQGFVSRSSHLRFRREAEVIANLAHPRLASVLDADLDGEVPWIAMRYVEGEDLGRAIQREREDRSGTRLLDSMREEPGDVGPEHEDEPLEGLAADSGELEPAASESGRQRADARRARVPGSSSTENLAAARPPSGERDWRASSTASGASRARLGATASTHLPLAPATRHELARLLEFFEQTARALHVAHEEGVVHRDVKPGNLMVDRAGEPMVLDFGLARAPTEAGLELTASGEVFGTPAYMSPEQWSGESVDARTDVYSLAVALFEALTLERPFEGRTRLVLQNAVLHGRPRRARRLNPRIPGDLEIVLEKALARDPRDRYATAAAFAEDLRRVRAFEPIEARPAGRLLRLRRWARREPALAAALTATFLALAVGLLVALRLLDDRGQALDRAHALLMAGRAIELSHYDEAAALALALEAAELVPGEETRTALLLALNDCDLERRFEERASPKALDVAFSPDGRLLAALFSPPFGATAAKEPTGARAAPNAEGAARATPAAGGSRWRTPVTGDAKGAVVAAIWDLESGERVVELPFDGDAPTRLCFVGDGAELWIGDAGGGVAAWRVEADFESIGSARLAGGAIAILQPAPAQDRLAVACADGSITFLATDDRRVLARAEPLAGLEELLWSPDGGHVLALAPMSALASSRGPKGMVRAVNGSARGTPPGVARDALESEDAGARDEREAAVSLDPVTLDRVAGDSPFVRWIEADTGRDETARIGPDAARLSRAAFDTRGHLFGVTTDGRILTWRFPGAAPDELARVVGLVHAFAVEPDGMRLVVGGETESGEPLLKLLRRNPRSSIIDVEGHGGPIVHAAFHPGGRSFATSSRDGNVHVWSSSAGREERVLTATRSTPAESRWSVDGRRLVTRSRSGSTLHVWKPGARPGLHRLGGPAAPLEWLGFAGGDERVVGLGRDGILRWWSAPRAESAELPGDLLAANRGHDRALGARRAGSRLLSWGETGEAALWSLDEVGRDPRGVPGSDRATAFDLAGDGRVAFVDAGGALRVWTEAAIDAYGSELEAGPLRRNRGAAARRRWRATQGEESSEEKSDESRSGERSVAPDAGERRPRELDDAPPSDGPLTIPPSSRGRWIGLRFDPLGARLACIGESGWVEVRRARDGELLSVASFPPPASRAPATRVRDLCWLPDRDALVLACDDASLRFFDARDGTPALPALWTPGLEGRRMLTARSLELSSDGARLLVIGEAGPGAVHVLDLASGSLWRMGRSHLAAVEAATFADGDRRVVTCSRDETAIVWSLDGLGDAPLARGELLLSHPHSESVTRVARPLDPRDGRVVTSTAEGRARIWPVDPLPLARRVLPRELEDWERERERRLGVLPP